MDDTLPPRVYFLAPDNASQTADLEKREDILLVLSGLCAMEGVEMTTVRSRALAQAMNDVCALPPDRRSIEALIEFVPDPEDALRAALHISPAQKRVVAEVIDDTPQVEEAFTLWCKSKFGDEFEFFHSDPKSSPFFAAFLAGWQSHKLEGE